MVQEIPTCSACGSLTAQLAGVLNSGRKVDHRCAGCGDPVCDDCLRTDSSGRTLCPDCWDGWELQYGGF